VEENGVWVLYLKAGLTLTAGDTHIATASLTGSSLPAQTFTLTVADAGTVPIFASLPTNLAIDENEDGSQTAIDIGSEITASGGAAGTSITYNLIAAPAGFSIDSTTGQIQYSGTGLDHETTETITFTVRAAAGAVSSTRDVTLTINDVDEDPAFDDAPTNLEIAESRDGTEVTGGILVTGDAITATDVDDDAITFSFQTAQTNWRIDETTGQIYYIGTGLDFETEDEVMLTIVATSTGSSGTAKTDTQTVTIAVTDADDAPVFDPLANSYTVPENVPIQPGSGLPISNRVTATDPDGDAITYSLDPATAGSDWLTF